MAGFDGSVTGIEQKDEKVGGGEQKMQGDYVRHRLVQTPAHAISILLAEYINTSTTPPAR